MHVLRAPCLFLLCSFLGFLAVTQYGKVEQARPTAQVPRSPLPVPFDSNALKEWLGSDEINLGDTLNPAGKPGTEGLENLLKTVSTACPGRLGEILTHINPRDVDARLLLRCLNMYAFANPLQFADFLIEASKIERTPWSETITSNIRQLAPAFNSAGSVLLENCSKSGRFPNQWPWQWMTMQWLSSNSQGELAVVSQDPPWQTVIPELNRIKKAMNGDPDIKLDSLAGKVLPAPLNTNFSEDEERRYGTGAWGLLVLSLDASNLGSLALTLSDQESASRQKITFREVQAAIGEGATLERIATLLPSPLVSSLSSEQLDQIALDIAIKSRNPFAPISEQISGIDGISSQPLRDKIIQDTMKHFAATDATGLSLWLNEQSPSPVRDAGILALTRELSNDPYAQKLWASQISDESMRTQLEASIRKEDR